MLHPLAQGAPLRLLQFSAGKLPSELSQMFAESEPAFIRAMCRAIFDWIGLRETTSKVYRIHGRGDTVIPPPAQVDLLLDGDTSLAEKDRLYRCLDRMVECYFSRCDLKIWS